MAAIDDIIRWANTIPSWQGDTVRRLLEAGDKPLTTEDDTEILALAKAELKLAPLPTSLISRPPAAGKFSGVPATTVAVKLMSIDDVRNVNIIKSGQTQQFAENGVTLIYGNNGSGKSGYSRILKLACQARDKDESILPNVFAIGSVGTPTATLKIKENSVIKDIIWKQDVAPDPILTNISVFDGRCARVITDEQNEITYLPYGCDVFPKLAEIVKKIKLDLEAEITNPEQIQDSSIQEGTPSSAFLKSLAATTKDQDIQVATVWTLNDEQQLTEKIELSRTSEPSKAIEEVSRLEKFKNRVNGAADNSADIFSLCSRITNNAIEKSLLELKAAEEAYAIAIQEMQTPEPLSGVPTTSQWQILYEAAKNYSEEVAYRGEMFPKTTEAVCVLCQQPLGEDATARFVRFKKYMEDTTSRTLAAKRATIISLRESVSRITPLTGATFESFCDEVVRYDSNAGESLRTFHSTVASHKENILAALSESEGTNKIALLTTWPHSPESALRGVVNMLVQKAADITKAAKPEEYKKLITTISELKSRKAINLRKSDIIGFVEKKRRDASIRNAVNSIGTTREITLHGKALIKSHLTPDFSNALKDELEELDAARLPISVKPTGGSGETTHEMLLVDSKVSAQTSQVLSEGEARVIAIAGFLAELRLAPHKNAIVLDDPVSSLDHVFTGKIAARLAKEGLTRQVIIFTHNIAFLMELEDARNELALSGTPVGLSVHTLRREGKSAGSSTDGAPWSAKKSQQRADVLEQLVNRIKPLYQINTPEYNDRAAFIYGKLRETWESCIENDLLDSIVCRYRNSVQILKLSELAIEDTDFFTIDRNYRKASRWMAGHDISKALHDDLPNPQEILDDIKALREFSTLIRSRLEKTKKLRAEKLKPN